MEAEEIYAQGREPVVDALLALSARLEAQDAKLAALAERVEELEQQLKRDSLNSSLPPSQDPPWLGKRGWSRGTGRKQGAQPGHVGYRRALFPIERATEVVDHWPQRCCCGHVFGEKEVSRVVRPHSGSGLRPPTTRTARLDRLSDAPAGHRHGAARFRWWCRRLFAWLPQVAMLHQRR